MDFNRENRMDTMDCAHCSSRVCLSGKDCTGTAEESVTPYADPEILKLFTAASTIEARHYMKYTRLEELIEFCSLMNYEHVGIAFCVGFSQEARILSDILGQHVAVTSVCCKACGVSKDRFDLPKIRPGSDEVICNPAHQAMIMNKAGCQLHVILGLCMGHDVVFTRLSRAPVTTFVVKDRVLAHNPAGALYSPYYRKNRFHLSG
jgi:uncharacterized metal-binding protein